MADPGAILPPEGNVKSRGRLKKAESASGNPGVLSTIATAELWAVGLMLLSAAICFRNTSLVDLAVVRLFMPTLLIMPRYALPYYFWRRIRTPQYRYLLATFILASAAIDAYFVLGSSVRECILGIRGAGSGVFTAMFGATVLLAVIPTAICFGVLVALPRLKIMKEKIPELPK